MRKIANTSVKVNDDFVNEENINDDILNVYSLIRSNQLSNEDSKLSKSYYLVKQYKELLNKKESDILTKQEQQFLFYLESLLKGK